jgi:hypothetical protein
VAIDAAPILREGRVFLPVRLWAEHFGLSVFWNESDGSVTVSEGAKALTITPGEKRLALTGGHFLKLYNQDESFLFFYPETGKVDVTWEGRAEILMTVDGEDLVITAINAGAGRADPIVYTEEEIEWLIHRNAAASGLSVLALSSRYYGVPAFRCSGIESGIPQAGVVFLRNGFLCGLTIEAKGAPPPDIGGGVEPDFDPEPGDGVSPEAAMRREAAARAANAAERDLHAVLAKINALLDEIFASFIVN